MVRRIADEEYKVIFNRILNDTLCTLVKYIADYVPEYRYLADSNNLTVDDIIHSDLFRYKIDNNIMYLYFDLCDNTNNIPRFLLTDMLDERIDAYADWYWVYSISVSDEYFNGTYIIDIEVHSFEFDTDDAWDE